MAPYYGTLCEIMVSDGNTRLARNLRNRMSCSAAGRADRCQDARPVCAEEGQYPRGGHVSQRQLRTTAFLSGALPSLARFNALSPVFVFGRLA